GGEVTVDFLDEKPDREIRGVGRRQVQGETPCGEETGRILPVLRRAGAVDLQHFGRDQSLAVEMHRGRVAQPPGARLAEGRMKVCPRAEIVHPGHWLA